MCDDLAACTAIEFYALPLGAAAFVGGIAFAVLVGAAIMRAFR